MNRQSHGKNYFIENSSLISLT